MWMFKQVVSRVRWSVRIGLLQRLLGLGGVRDRLHGDPRRRDYGLLAYGSGEEVYVIDVNADDGFIVSSCLS